MDDSCLSNLKTHDWQNFLKHVLPLVIDGCLTTGVHEVVYRFGKLARYLSTRWMFWVERFMGVLKGFVRQRARPEGSMSEGWVLGECMYYLIEYLERIDEDAPCK
ncbi:hypothetical protein L7F22_007109 [Adiantum nelumboides]|nr:hypothetical protein [Adiantum nelumboides]